MKKTPATYWTPETETEKYNEKQKKSVKTTCDTIIDESYGKKAFIS